MADIAPALSIIRQKLSHGVINKIPLYLSTENTL